MNSCACGCGRPCRGQYARGHHPRSHEYAPSGAPSQQMVLEAVINGARSRKQIAAALKVPTAYLGTILNRLKSKGRIKRGRRIGEWEPA